MTFWDHLDALRGVIFRIALVLVVLGIAAFCAMPWIFDHVVLAPCRADFPFYRLTASLQGMAFMPGELGDDGFELKPVSLELTSQFFTHMTASCWAAFVFGFPIIIYLLWGFVAPGLYPEEKRGIHRAFFFGNLMFFLGVLCGYYIVFPLALRFLATYSLSDQLQTVVSLDSYMDNFFTLILVMGAVFELPLLSWVLGKMGFLDRAFFSRYRRHAIVALLIAAAMITPTGDPFTLAAVFIPIYALWEFSATLVPRPEPATISQP